MTELKCCIGDLKVSAGGEIGLAKEGLTAQILMLLQSLKSVNREQEPRTEMSGNESSGSCFDAIPSLTLAMSLKFTRGRRT